MTVYWAALKNRLAKAFDRALIALVSARLTMNQQAGDTADRFADELIAVLAGETERRNRARPTWGPEAKILRLREVRLGTEN